MALKMTLCLLVLGIICLQRAVLGKTALQQLGMLLGLPMDRDYGSLKHRETPQFFKDVYNCWSSANQSHDSCLPGYYGKDVNLLRTSLGVETQSPSQAFHSYNTAKDLNGSLEISFNVSHTTGQMDIVRYALLRVYRRAVSPDQWTTLLHSCSNNMSDLKLQLYTQTSTRGEAALFSLRAVQSLSDTDFTREGWVEFLNITRLYRSLVDSMLNESGEIYSTRLLRTRLVLSGEGGCSGNLSLQDLGFGSVSYEHRAQLVGLVESKLQKSFKFSRVVLAVMEDKVRNRREATEETVGSGGDSDGLTIPDEPLPLEASTEDIPTQQLPSSSPPPPTSATARQAPISTSTVSPSDIRELSYTRCSHRSHYISFADISLDHKIIFPSGYYANYCAGTCNWPQTPSERTNHHSSIQSHANFINSDLIPPPCCAPRPDSLGKLVTTVIGETEGEIKIQIFDDMIANECGCF